MSQHSPNLCMCEGFGGVSDSAPNIRTVRGAKVTLWLGSQSFSPPDRAPTNSHHAWEKLGMPIHKLPLGRLSLTFGLHGPYGDVGAPYRLDPCVCDR